jgi:D-alanine-D-alanine ligase
MELPEVLRGEGLRVAVLCGGSGSEREVSLVSGKAVMDAFDAANVPCDLFQLTGHALPEELDPALHLVLPIVHGAYGEDGMLSAELAAGGFSYAGCEQSASVLCFDKLACKTIAARVGLPVADDYLLPAGENHSYEAIAGTLGPTFILKPGTPPGGWTGILFNCPG